MERSRLNRWVRETLPHSGIRHLFVILVIILLLFGSYLIACGGGGTSHPSIASSTSQTTSLSNIPSSATTSTTASRGGGSGGPGPASTSTTGTTGQPTKGATTTPTGGPTSTPTGGPTTTPTGGPTITPTEGPTITPTAVPPPDPSSFTITIQGGTLCYTGTAGQTDANGDPNNNNLDLNYTGSANPPPGPINWTVSTLMVPSGETSSVSCSDPSSCTSLSGNWLSFNPSSHSISYGTINFPITPIVSHSANMPPGVYCEKFQFNPLNRSNFGYVELAIVPGVSSISPASGPTTGGTPVTITGSGFTGATGVLFGSSAASSFTFVSDTQITAVSPAGTGTVDVTVTDSFGTSLTNNSDQFTYNAPPPGPVISSISPTNGPAAGGTTVTITGTGFTGVTGVSFGSTLASSVTFVSDTQITAVSPAGTATGTVDVTVTTPNGTSATGAADQFTYT